VLGVLKAIMAEAGVSVGDTLNVVVRDDDAPRKASVPDDLAEAVARNDAASAAFDDISYSHRREYVDAINEVKRPETRARRIERTIQAMLQRVSGD